MGAAPILERHLEAIGIVVPHEVVEERPRDEGSKECGPKECGSKECGSKEFSSKDVH